MRMRTSSVHRHFTLAEQAEFARHALGAVKLLMPNVEIALSEEEALSELAIHSGWRKPNLRLDCTHVAQRSYALTIATRFLRKLVLGTLPPLQFEQVPPAVLQMEASSNVVQAKRRRHYDEPAVCEAAAQRQDAPPAPDENYAERQVQTVLEQHCPLLHALSQGISLLVLKRQLAKTPGSKGTPRGIFEAALRDECAVYARLVGEEPADVWQRAAKALAAVSGTRGKYKPRTRPNRTWRGKPVGGSLQLH